MSEKWAEFAKLTDDEKRDIAWDGPPDTEVVATLTVDDSHRWFLHKQTVWKDADGLLWAYDWQQGKTECQEHEYPDDPPYRVEAREVKTVEYVAL